MDSGRNAAVIWVAENVVDWRSFRNKSVRSVPVVAEFLGKASSVLRRVSPTLFADVVGNRRSGAVVVLFHFLL